MKINILPFRVYLFFTTLLVLLWASAGINSAKAQLVVTDASNLPNWSADSLVRNILLDNGLSISNARYNGSSSAINCNSIGVFATGNHSTNLGIESGLIIASGGVSVAVGPNNNEGLSVPTTCSSYSDSDLSSIASSTTNDVAVLEFDFVPWSDTLSFKFVFGSEEYMEYAGSNYNDVFGFFLQGQKPQGGEYNHQNMALIPGTNEVVSINNVNLNHNGQYYVDNSNGQTIQFDGFTTPIEVSFPVVPMTTYHIKFAICDVTDNEYDSGVFIEAQSFTTNFAYSMTIDTLLYNDIPDDYYFCANRVIEFNTVTDWNFDNIVWYFGDGTTATGADVTHVYEDDGLYNVMNVLYNPHRSNDSIFLNKTILVKTAHSESEAKFCQGQSYVWNGKEYYYPGIYVDTIELAGRCDSIVTLTLSYFDNDTTYLNVSQCDSYDWNGQTYYLSGSYYSYEQNVQGCDSIVILRLSIINSDTTQLNVFACDEYQWNGYTFNQSGVYEFHEQSSLGCDSLIILNLDFENGFYHSESVTVCDRYPWPSAEGGFLTESGHYHYEGVTATGCDSVVDLDLIINHTPELNIIGMTQVEVASDLCPGIYNYFISDTSELAQCTINWSCSEPSWQILPNSNPYGCTIVVRSLGYATLTATTNCSTGCNSQYSIDIFSSSYDINDLEDGNMTVYPNPANTLLNIEANALDHIKMFNVYGQVVKDLAFDKVESATIDISDLLDGIYLIEISTLYNKTTKQVLISK